MYDSLHWIHRVFNCCCHCNGRFDCSNRFPPPVHLSYNPGMKMFQFCVLAVSAVMAGLIVSGCTPPAAPPDAVLPVIAAPATLPVAPQPGGTAAPAATEGTTAPPATVPKPDPSDEVFARPDITMLTLEIAPGELAKLVANAREYVRCRLVEQDGATWQDVAVKLKGAAGSFRELNDKPAFTLNIDKFRKKQSFHGLQKLHLNNSVQDETYLHEWLCAGLFREAGVAVPRVTHARVFLNERDLGLYVLKEGFDRRFLSRHFAADDGNLYDGGFCQDIDADLERDAGKGVDDFSDLHALRDACGVSEPEQRWQQIAERLDVDAFLTFAAMELMTCHWDGYCRQKNNYRLYFDATSHKAFFLPHGMDQMFGDPGASILERPGAIVASAVMQNPEWREKFRDRIRKLLPLFHPPAKLLGQVDLMEPRIRAALEQIDPNQATSFAERVGELKERLRARAENLVQQVDQPDPPPPQPLEFSGEEGVELADWQPASESEDAVVEVAGLPDDRSAYLIRCGPGGRCIASWRRTVLLSRGAYRLVASAATTDVAPLADEKGAGAGLRISGSVREAGLEGTADWHPLEYRFQVTEDEQEVTLVAELRATAGQVQFDATSMRIFREAAAE